MCTTHMKVTVSLESLLKENVREKFLQFVDLNSQPSLNCHVAIKTRHCSTLGCDDTGHKNTKRWSEGHTTRAGCPIYHGVSGPQ